MSETKVPTGTPITTEQATRAVLRLLRSPLVGNVDVDTSPGYTLSRLMDEPIHSMLSSGERRIVAIAKSIWNGPPGGADIWELGGIDKHSRRTVLIVLWYLHMGDDRSALEISEEEWTRLFATVSRPVANAETGGTL